MFPRAPRVRPTRVGLLLVALTLTSARAEAAPITFTFDSITFSNRSQELGNSAVQNHLSSVWAGTTVTGAIGLLGYDGDGHVVGPKVGSTVTPYTLGTTDAGVPHTRGNDAFIANNGSGRYTITFPAKVYAVSFDYEIFPNGHEIIPDMTFQADGTTVFYLRGLLPGTDPNAPFTTSRVSNNEHYYQRIGSFSTVFPNGVTALTFIDWPPRVGIDNLVVNPTAPNAPAVPEPISVATWLAGLVGLGLVARRARRAAPSAVA